jgi:CheY-like chemotaxis protein
MRSCTLGYRDSKSEQDPPKRVLVIDDEAAVREVVQGCLEEMAGWEVLTASSGYEGLLKASAESPDAIVVDVMMPGMDGLTFLQRLRADLITQPIPVVLLTAKSDLTTAQQVLHLGVAGAIGKPFDPILLCTQIANALGWSMTGLDFS